METTDSILKQQAFPCPELFPYVDRYWAWENRLPETTLKTRMLPGTGKELVFHYGSPFLHEHSDGALGAVPQAHLICQRSETAVLQSQPKTGFIAIRFRTGGFRHFCRTPAAELADTFVDIDDIDADFHRLKMRIMEAHGFQECIRLIEACLLKLLRVSSARDAYLDHAVNSFYYGHASVSPAKLCDDMGLGLRQFQRRFKSSMGMSPKRFIRLSRFQHMVKSLLLNGAESMIDTALSHGFYDQAHFIHDFKEFSGLAPCGFLESQKNMTHFYNRSRPEMSSLQSPTTEKEVGYNDTDSPVSGKARQRTRT